MYRTPYPYPNTILMNHHPPGGGAPLPILAVPVVAPGPGAGVAVPQHPHLALFASPTSNVTSTAGVGMSKQELKKKKKEAKKEKKEFKKEKKRQKKLKKQMKKEIKRAKKAAKAAKRNVSGVRTKFLLESARQEYYTVQEENSTLRKIIEAKLPHVAPVIFDECCPPRKNVSSIDELVDLMPTGLKIEDEDNDETVGGLDTDETVGGLDDEDTIGGGDVDYRYDDESS